MPVSPVVEITFALSAIIILLSSLAVVLVKNPVRATLLLILAFLPTSLVYILLQAAFVGILQILVYAGAIMMLFTFVIMMINPSPKDGESPVGGSEGGEGAFSGLRGALIGLLFVGCAGALVLPKVYHAAAEVSTAAVTKPGFGGLASISAMLFEDPANNTLTVSFELISFLILVGIIAALNFSRRKGADAAKENTISTRPTEALPVVQREPALDRESSMPSLFNLPDCLMLSLLLVLIGSYGVFRRRSLIMILLSVEVMLNGVNLSLVSFNFFRWGTNEASQYLYMLSIGVAAVEAAVGLSMIIVLFKNYNDITRERVAHLGERA